MNKKIIFPIIIAFLLIGSVIAGSFLKDKNIKIDKERLSALNSIGLDNYNYTDTKIGYDIIERCLFKENVINDCNRFNITDLTQLEINNMLDDWEKERIIDIANAIIQRQADKIMVKVTEGKTNLVEDKVK